MPLNEEGFIARVSIRHSVSADAVRTILRALRSGGGTMAQFSHPDFGGMSQWSPGMTMVGDMFNSGLKSKLGCRPESGWNLVWRILRSHEGIVSGGKVNLLINGLSGKRLPTID